VCCLGGGPLINEICRRGGGGCFFSPFIYFFLINIKKKEGPPPPPPPPPPSPVPACSLSYRSFSFSRSAANQNHCDFSKPVPGPEGGCCGTFNARLWPAWSCSRRPTLQPSFAGVCPPSPRSWKLVARAATILSLSPAMVNGWRAATSGLKPLAAARPCWCMCDVGVYILI